MQNSEPHKKLQPHMYEILNRNKSQKFSLDDHKARTTQVFADFEEYKKILRDLKKRVELLEDIDGN